MKTSILLAVVASIWVLQGVSGQETRRKILIAPPVGEQVGERVVAPKPPVTIDFADGKLLKVIESTNQTDFTDSTGKVIHSVARPLGLRGFWDRAVSPYRTAAAFLINRIEAGYHWDAYLLIVRVEKGEFVFERGFPSGVQVIPGKNTSLSRVGAISDDGKTILAEFGVSPMGPGSVEYQWQTWEVSPPKLLGVGLTIANGVKAKRSE